MDKTLTQYELSKLLPLSEQTTLHEEARDLCEDLMFFKLYMNRNKKSNFEFNVSISKGMANKFLEKLWVSFYGRRAVEKEVLELVTAYKVVKLLMVLLNNETNNMLSNVQIKSVVDHFAYCEIKLSDYVGDFVGCSQACTSVIKKLKAIESEYMN